MGIGTFGAFTQARLAIYAAQTGLSVTGNNISNINTPGYTRQRLNQVSLNVAGSDRWYAVGDVRSGQGVLAKSLSQIRNPYLDIRFREENAKVGYYDARLEGLNSIARILDEVGKGVDEEEGFGVVAKEISSLIDALQDLTTQTGHQEYDNIVRQVAANLVSRLNGYANRLEEVYQDTITSLNSNVDRINDILNGIRTYNEEIRVCDIHGDAALELRDNRNLLLDELSGLIDINVTYTEETIAPGLTVEKLVVRLGNANPDSSVRTDESLLIDGVYAAQLSMGKPVDNPYYKMTEEEWTDVKRGLESSLRTALDAELRQKEEYADIGTIEGKASAVPPETLTDEESALLDKFNAELDGEVADALNAYRTSPYQDKAGKPASDIRDASIVVGDNYDFMVTELKNRVGELYKYTEKSSEVKVTDDDVIASIKDLFGNLNSYREEVPDAAGDTTITVYRRTLKYRNVEKQAEENGELLFEDDDKTIPKMETVKEPYYEYTKQVFKQIVTKPVALKDNDLGGELQANRELLTEKGEFIDESVVTDGIDTNAVTKRGIRYYQYSLDLLAQQLAGVLNEANQGFLVDPDGNYITGTTHETNGETVADLVTITLADGTEHTLKQSDDLSENTQLRDALLEAINPKGLTLPAGFTDKDILNAYLKGQTFDEKEDENGDMVVELSPYDEKTSNGVFVGGNLFSNGNDTDDDTNITASNISISKTWQVSHILQRDFTCPLGKTEPASGASENIRHMVYLLDTQKYDFNAKDLASTSGAAEGPMFNGTFFEYWNNVGFTMGKDQDFATTELNVAYETALAIDTDRSSVSSVDFNDEAMNLMMYSKSYNAACRLMTTIDSMLDKLINGTGMTT